MARGYQPTELEARHYARWEAAGYFAPSGEGEPYAIVLPPPNITGTLHMGHAFQVTVMDALIRYHRMRGRRTLWQGGTDHAGIATQMVVERLLSAEGKSKHDLGRDAFVERVWEWKERSGSQITRQLRRIGSSLDWSRECFTMDPERSRAVTEVFVRLHEDGLIYRGKRLVNWDPVLHTALSDLEVLSTEERGKLWRFRYPLVSGDGHVVVATTRPETMLGDTAVAVHPNDLRYRDLVGHSVRLPLAEREIPIVADEYVDPEFGTGCVKITPAHDFNDYQVGQRHGLPLLSIFDADACLNDAAPAAYRKLDRFTARERIVADMQAAGLVEGIDDHVLVVPRGDRSGAVIEPYLTDQWYVRAKALAEPAIEAVETGRVRFIPENWSKTYFEWMHNIQDWCISRQLWWGHRIPAWYDGDGNIYVGRTEREARDRHGLGTHIDLRQDPDVLDTWFSSALWPFSTMGWPRQTPELETFYPGSVLVTGFDIIFFWVARMIMMGLRFMGDVPFREVYIHGLVRDHDGQKMSKSKGNILDPIDLIDGVDLDTLLEKRTEGMMQPHLKAKVEQATRKEFADGIPGFGADAMRMTFASLATTGRDINLDIGRVEGYRNFCNKLWNATQFVCANVDAESRGEVELGIADRWIRSRLRQTIETVHASTAEYRLDLYAQTLYEFTWHELCDWYLELSKPVLSDPDASAAQAHATRRTLAETLGAALKLLHPLMPFITEELWLTLCAKTGAQSESIMTETLPEPAEFAADTQADDELQWIKGVVTGVRQIRGEMSISPGKRLSIQLADLDATDRERVGRHRACLDALARLDRIEILDAVPQAGGVATALVRQFRVLVPLAGVIDVGAERSRLTKQRDRLQQDLDKTRAKLANAQFLANAPASIVEKEKGRAADLCDQIETLEAQLTQL
ncbi:MAG TPA: valine--tRNA ligase [Gammaproteobacteria bacterium]|jgi:valyl-tRNA synthetase